MITIIYLVGVAALWGVTNPLIRLASQGIESVNTGSKLRNIFEEFKIIVTRLIYWIPFIFNQLGSVLYLYTLQRTPMMSAVPVTNSLSFAFTAITGYLLGERAPTKRIIIGTILVCVGSILMLYDGYNQFEKESTN